MWNRPIAPRFVIAKLLTFVGGSVLPRISTVIDVVVERVMSFNATMLNVYLPSKIG
jgi:hypothetical protein